MKTALSPIFSTALSSSLKAGASVLSGKFKMAHPWATQKRILRSLIRRAQDTDFGREHGFDRLIKVPTNHLYTEFSKSVPIRTYDDFWNDYFSRGVEDADGKMSLRLTNVTWPGTIQYFCETSGTTAPSKFIPFTKEMFRANKWAALDLMSCYLSSKPESKLFDGRLLYMAGSTDLTDRGAGIVSGDMSGITLAQAPWFLRPFVWPGKEISVLPWEERLDRMTDLLLEDRDIRGISGVPPWILLLLQRCVEKARTPIPELLPNLELIIHGGTSMKPYRKEFDALFGNNQPSFLEVLPSSEAFMGFQVHGEQHMRLTPYYGAFFEFVHFDDLDDRGRPAPDAPAVSLADVVPGERYAIILSTCSGLWRYHIGDTIRFLSLEPLHIEFTGRDRFLDRFEEKVTQGEVEEAVARLNRQGLHVREFVVGPEIECRRHRWVLATKEAATGTPEDAGKVLDRTLMDLNADYATFRSQGRIAEPAVTIVSEETIYEWSRNVRGKLGGQTKIPHVDPTMEGEMVRSLLDYIG